jgi:hypothetical protein
MGTSGRSDHDRPGRGGGEDGDGPASARTTPPPGACMWPATGWVVTKRDRKAFSAGCTGSSTLRPLSMVPGTSSFERRVKPDVDSAFPAHDVVRHRAGGGWVPKISLSDLNAAAVGGDLACHVLQRGCGSARKEGPRSTASECPRLGAPTEPAAPPGQRHRVVELHLQPPSGAHKEWSCWKTFRGCPTTTEVLVACDRPP